MTGLRVTDLRFTSAHAGDVQCGLVGYLACTVDGVLRLDGIALRRTLDGRFTLSFPERRDRAGRSHPYMRPVDDAARQQIERELFRHLGLDAASARPTS